MFTLRSHTNTRFFITRGLLWFFWPQHAITTHTDTCFLFIYDCSTNHKYFWFRTNVIYKVSLITGTRCDVSWENLMHPGAPLICSLIYTKLRKVTILFCFGVELRNILICLAYKSRFLCNGRLCYKLDKTKTMNNEMHCYPNYIMRNCWPTSDAIKLCG